VGAYPKDDGERSVIADNIFNRDFAADRSSQKWLADFTYIWTAEGWLYLAVILNLHSRRVIGWAFSNRMKRDPAIRALNMAIALRSLPRGRILHSDRLNLPNIPVSSFSACWPTTASPAQ
jgi:putative transposase